MSALSSATDNPSSDAPMRTVAIAQPTHLGDVVSCLPMAAVLKREWPGVRILFIARSYVRTLVEACVHIDEFIEHADAVADPGLLAVKNIDVLLNPFLADDIGGAAKAAGIPIRVGNLRRPRTLKWANRFIWIGSHNVPLHIANVNLRYLRPLGIRVEYTQQELAGLLGVERTPKLDAQFAALLGAGEKARPFNLIVHAKSNKSGREWPAAHFDALVAQLPPERFRIFLTGRTPEREALLAEAPALLTRPGVVDLMGRMSLDQMIAFVGAVDGLVGNSTGPLHIAGALGRHTLGLFPGRDRANPQKWRPLGPHAETITFREYCKPGPGRCPARYKGEACSCMSGIAPVAVAQRLMDWLPPDQGC